MIARRLAALVCLVAGGVARAQEAINSDAALQPGTGSTILRQAFRYSSLNDPNDSSRDGSLFESTTSIAHGVYDGWTLIVTAPVRYLDLDSPAGNTEELGVGDVTVLGKARLYRDDFGTNNTFRVAALGGLELPTYDEPFSRESFNPMIGGVGTLAAGRHGASADAIWTFDTGSIADDRLRYDLAYTYRVTPTAFSDAYEPTVYGVLEANGMYSADGDHEIMLSPGMRYVMPRWTIEATVLIPVFQEVDERLERELSVGIVFRVHF